MFPKSGIPWGPGGIECLVRNARMTRRHITAATTAKTVIHVAGMEDTHVIFELRRGESKRASGHRSGSLRVLYNQAADAVVGLQLPPRATKRPRESHIIPPILDGGRMHCSARRFYREGVAKVWMR